jgi:hypothetical protein
MRKDESAITTHGVETQVYRKESGTGDWFTSTIPKITKLRLEQLKHCAESVNLFFAT